MSAINPQDEADSDYSMDYSLDYSTDSSMKISTDDGTNMLPFPLPMTYVTVRLEPVGSVASLEDEATMLDASRIPTKTYVGYVGDVCHLYSSSLFLKSQTIIF